MPSHGRRPDPVEERRRRILVQVVAISALAAVALVLVVMALRKP